MRFVALSLFLIATMSSAQDAPLSAAQLIAGAKAGKPSGAMIIRARMEQKTGDAVTSVMNVQIKRRSTPEGSDQLYQVTFAKNPELKGSALLLHTTGSGFSGAVFTPGKGVRKLTTADRKLSVFGTDMTVEDVLADFLSWTKHETIGNEKQQGNECAVIESKPTGGASGIAKVKSWVELKRYIPWRIEVYETGQSKPSRVEETLRVLRGGSGYWFPREFIISTPSKGTSTKVEGTNSDQDKSFTDADFSEAALGAGAK